jgi:hypothetical protein
VQQLIGHRVVGDRLAVVAVAQRHEEGRGTGRLVHGEQRLGHDGAVAGHAIEGPGRVEGDAGEVVASVADQRRDGRGGIDLRELPLVRDEQQRPQLAGERVQRQALGVLDRRAPGDGDERGRQRHRRGGIHDPQVGVGGGNGVEAIAGPERSQCQDGETGDRGDETVRRTRRHGWDLEASGGATTACR